VYKSDVEIRDPPREEILSRAGERAATGVANEMHVDESAIYLDSATDRTDGECLPPGRPSFATPTPNERDADLLWFHPL